MGCCCWTQWWEEASGGEAGGWRGQMAQVFQAVFKECRLHLGNDGGPWKASAQGFSTGDDFLPYTLFPGDA